MRTLTFRTSSLLDPITPRTPIDEEVLVHKSTGIIVDTYEIVESVYVDDVLAYNSSLVPSFRNSWTGEVGQITGGWRLVLVPPVVYEIGDQPEILINTTSYTLTYTSEIGTEQLTTSNDVSVPRILDIDGTNIYVGYGRDTGNIYLRKIDPDTGEVKLVIGKHFAIGHNPYTNKSAVVFNINGSLFLTEANLGDPPNTLTDPTILKDEITTNIAQGYLVAEPREIQNRHFQNVEITAFPPIKQFLIDDFNVVLGTGRNVRIGFTPFSKQQAPLYINFDPPILRIVRPSEEPERSALVGYYMVHYYPDTNTLGSTHYISIGPTEEFADFEDTHTPEGVVYVVIPVYNFLGYGPDENGPISDYEIPPPTAGADIIETHLGPGQRWNFNRTLYTVLKLFGDDDVYTHVGAGRLFSVFIEGFGTIGIGS